MPENALFTVNTDARTVEGLLLPFGEMSRLGTKTKTAPISFGPATVDLPADPSVVTLNRDHDQFEPLGRAVALAEQPDGIHATFSIAQTPEGDRFLTEDYPAGRFTKLSAELRGIVRDAVDTSKGVKAALTGAALCMAGSFESAGLFSIDGSALETEDPKQTIQTAPATSSPSQAATTHQEENPMPNATIPAGLAASAAQLVAEPEKVNEKDARDVFALITGAMKGDHDAEKMLAALSDITLTGAGALPVAGVLQPNWLGEVWQQKSYQRRYMTLIRQGDIKAIDEKGFTVSATGEPVQPWNGNKSALPSSGGSTDVLSAVFQRWAWAADIAREFYDIPGNEALIEAFIRLVANSYARVTDKWTLQQLVGAATLVAPDAYPALPTGSTDYPTAIKQLIQGVDYVSADPVDDTPAFAIANPAAWKEIIYAPADALPKWVTLDFGIPAQTGNVSGVRVVRGDIGIEDTPAVLVGATDAAHVNELPGASPLNLSALDIANGGIDRASVGYTQYMTDYAAALVTIGTADAGA